MLHSSKAWVVPSWHTPPSAQCQNLTMLIVSTRSVPLNLQGGEKKTRGKDLKESVRRSKDCMYNCMIVCKLWEVCFEVDSIEQEGRTWKKVSERKAWKRKGSARILEARIVFVISCRERHERFTLGIYKKTRRRIWKRMLEEARMYSWFHIKSKAWEIYFWWTENKRERYEGDY